METYLGTAKVDITPATPIPLAGFAIRKNNPYEKIASRIYARIAYFEQKDLLAGDTRKALIVSADVIWWGSDRIPFIMETMRARWNLQPEEVILHGTHSHSGPQTSSLFHPLLGTCDMEYITEMEQRLIAGVAEAIQNIEPVTIERGHDELHYGIYRRPWKSDIPAPVDPEVTVIRYVTSENSTKAFFVHFTCHPVTTTDPYVSAEFSGIAMQLLEEQLGDGIAFYLQGCCGDTNIDLSSVGTIAGRGHEEHIQHYGKLLAQTVMQIANRPLTLLAPVPLRGQKYSLALTTRPSHAGHEEWQSLIDKGAEPQSQWARHMINNDHLGLNSPSSVTLEMVRLDLAEGLSLLTFNAEMVVQYGLYTKQLSQGTVLPIAYSNGMFGYVPTAQQIREGGYEAVDSTYYFYMPGQLVESTEMNVKNKLQEIITFE